MVATINHSNINFGYIQKVMKEYKIAYEFNGRKMYTIVRARNVEDAKQQINDRLNFIEVKDITPPDETVDYIKNLFNMK